MAGPDDQPRPVPPLVPALGVLGAALLLVGVFAPAAVRPSGAPLSYREVSLADGNLVIGLGAAAFVLTWVFRWYRGLFVAGGGALLMMGATLLKVPRSGLGDAALSWGWLPLAAGGVLLLVAAGVAERGRPREPAEGPPPSEDHVEPPSELPPP